MVVATPPGVAGLAQTERRLPVFSLHQALGHLLSLDTEPHAFFRWRSSPWSSDRRGGQLHSVHRLPGRHRPKEWRKEDLPTTEGGRQARGRKAAPGGPEEGCSTPLPATFLEEKWSWTDQTFVGVAGEANKAGSTTYFKERSACGKRWRGCGRRAGSNPTRSRDQVRQATARPGNTTVDERFTGAVGQGWIPTYLGLLPLFLSRGRLGRLVVFGIFSSGLDDY